MKRTGLMPLAVAALVGCASLLPAYAAPPTATPSPGYDARLQEQRAASAPVYQPVAPVTGPVTPRRVKRARAH
jgi:hypothetical protein